MSKPRCSNCARLGHNIQTCVFQKRDIKICTNCGTEKSKSEFYKSPAATDGVEGKCKDCRRILRTGKIPAICRCTNCGLTGHSMKSCLNSKNIMKFCNGCKKEKLRSEFGKHIGRGDLLTTRCTKCQNISRSFSQYRKKFKVIENYGGKCICCGENELGFLTIDHGNNDGAAHRKKICTKGGTWFYSWIIKNNFPNNLGLQVLCWNCNSGRQMNGSICPHILSSFEKYKNSGKI